MAHQPRVVDFIYTTDEEIPQIYQDLRKKMASIGTGISLGNGDAAGYKFLMSVFTEEEAAAIIPMKYQWQTPAEYASLTGKTQEEAGALLWQLSKDGKIYRKRSEDGDYVYQPAPKAHGVWEWHVDEQTPDWVPDFWIGTNLGTAYSPMTPDNPYPFTRTMPIGKDVLGEGESLLPYDDLEKYIRDASCRVVWTCACAEAYRKGGVPLPEGIGHVDEIHDLETCLVLNDMAEFYQENGWGRELTVDQALTHFRGLAARGYVPQTYNSQKGEVICFCKGMVCGLLMGRKYRANTNQTHQNYIRRDNLSLCIGCGACVKACPIDIVKVEKGKSVFDGALCLGCGICVRACPTDAIKIYQKSDFVPPEDMIENQDKQIAFSGRIRYFDPMQGEGK